MTNNKQSKENGLMTKVEAYARERMEEFSDPSHDFFHVLRVRRLALHIANSENVKDLLAVELAALLHDVDDHKYKSIKEWMPVPDFLRGLMIDEVTITKVLMIIENVSYSREVRMLKAGKQLPTLPELGCVQDADRLDAIGATGVARTFAFGGKRDTPFCSEVSKCEAGWEAVDPKTTIGHFHDKLFKLKDMMKTETGRSMAKKRHQVMVNFYKAFMLEWTF